MKQIMHRKKDENVKFRLDGKWYGEGIVELASQENKLNVEVRLTTSCKEFQIGDKIIVSLCELI